jgi:hypothetical protein
LTNFLMIKSSHKLVLMYFLNLSEKQAAIRRCWTPCPKRQTMRQRCLILNRGIVLIILLIFIDIICGQMPPLFILLLNGFYCIFWICLKSKLLCIKTKYHFGCMIKSNWLILYYRVYNLIEIESVRITLDLTKFLCYDWPLIHKQQNRPLGNECIGHGNEWVGHKKE